MICEWVYLRSHVAFFLSSSKKGKLLGSGEKLFIFNLPFLYKFYFIIKGDKEWKPMKYIAEGIS